MDDEFVKIHTGLPNAKVVKAVFEHVSKTQPSDDVTKLLLLQEFVDETKNVWPTNLGLLSSFQNILTCG